MRFHPTRLLFRRLLLNPDLLFRCTTRPRVVFDRRHGIAVSLLQHPPRRSLFGFSRKPEKELREADIEPGLNQMAELAMAQKMRHRPPTGEYLRDAFNKFIASKKSSGRIVTHLEAQLVLRTFRYLRDTPRDDGGYWLSNHHLSLARRSMLRVADADKPDAHNKFAKEVFAEITKRRKSAESAEKSVSSEKLPPSDKAVGNDLLALVKVLTATGDSLEARTHVEKFWAALTPSSPNFESNKTLGISMWNQLMKGYVREQNEEELLHTFRLMELGGVPYTALVRLTMTQFYIAKGDVAATKAWFNKKSEVADDDKSAHTFTLYSEILRFSIQNNEIEWCNSVFRSLLESNPYKRTWDVIFMWAAGVLGKGVEDVERMMAVMIRRNPDNPEIRPDHDTVNGLVELASSLGDPYTAERYIALGIKWGIQPNAQTFILQMNYRLDAGDLAGAQVSYEALLSEEIENGADTPVINKYIQKLCAAKTVNYDLMKTVISGLEERKERLTGDTVTALCLMNLRRNDLREVANILQTHSYHHTDKERSTTRDALVGFVLDKSNDTQLVWDTYIVLRYMYGEMNIEIRTRIMREFFERKRPDMATYVFGHMRQHDNPARRPILETYVAAFSGFSLPGCASPEHVDTIHNMLKLDSTVEPNTQLRNSLMLAYTAIEEPRRAIEFWEDITNSIEGPTYASIEIVFGACQILPFGEKPAKSIWNKMRRMEIEVTPGVFAAYVGALAGQGLEAESKELIEGMEADVGFGPDVTTLATLYNTTLNQNRKDKIKAWAMEMYPKIWKEVEALGQIPTPDGWRIYDIKKEVKA